MREIKFRAWCKITKKMKDVTCVSNWSVDEKIDDYFEEPQQIQDHTGNWYSSIVIMQFTGLLDQNGKEVYESDIIRHTNEEASHIPYLVPQITPENWQFLNGIMDSEWDEGNNQYSNIEIIGNIFENHELLK